MKKALYTTALLIFLTASFTQVIKAQDNWIQGKTGIYSAGVGGTQLIYLSGSNYGYGYNRTSNIGLSLNISGEYKVWNWIGAGLQTGIDFLWYDYTYDYLGYSNHYSGGKATVVIPIGGKINAHLMDAFGVGIANKLDVYAGLGLGFGPSFYTGPSEGHSVVGGIMYVGPQVGVRYWVISNLGIFAEFGYGATFANAGVTF